jgi:hypothetical protein
MSATPECPQTVPQDRETSNGRNVNRRQLVNKLNFINFQDETIIAHFRHVKYDSSLSLKVRPLPCAGEQLDCSWIDTPGQTLRNYQFDHLLIPDGKKPLLAQPKLIASSEEGISFLLPVTCREFTLRKIKRHPVTGIRACFTQNSALFRGALMDFTPVALRVEGSEDAPQTFSWINPDIPVDLHLYSGDELLYSGECAFIRSSTRQATRTFVLAPVNNSIRRFRPKQYRSMRHQLVPSPNIVFRHPLVTSTINLKVLDLSGSGMAVEENEDESVLMPGMIIPHLELRLAHGFSIACKAQVLSRNVIDRGDGERVVRCGMTILDMDIHEHVQLLSILHQAADKNSYICTDVDMDALWDFFFETGFIYPEKYAGFQAEKEQIKKTYAKLYGANPHIARHFIHLSRGIIQGHMAMVRFYEKSWLIHHHAARKNASLKAGLTVLNQISHYINELHNHYFAHLDYVYCYFRPENRFPNRVFGGFAEKLDDRRGCSLDKFAYFHYHKSVAHGAELAAPWELAEACAADLEELCHYYGYVSGGLMVDATDLRPERLRSGGLTEEYGKLGFKKEQHRFSLKRDGSLKAVALVNLTDAGFNMANLTNCATLILLDDDIPTGVIDAALGEVSARYYGHEMPVLLYPFSYVETTSYPYEKSYMLWILNLNYSDDYFKYCDDLYKMSGKTA